MGRIEMCFLSVTSLVEPVIRPSNTPTQKTLRYTYASNASSAERAVVLDFDLNSRHMALKVVDSAASIDALEYSLSVHCWSSLRFSMYAQVVRVAKMPLRTPRAKMM